MEYTVFYPDGRRQMFWLLCVAQLYQQVYGGTLIGPMAQPPIDSVDERRYN